jgi:hypothetical protein
LVKKQETVETVRWRLDKEPAAFFIGMKNKLIVLEIAIHEVQKLQNCSWDEYDSMSIGNALSYLELVREKLEAKIEKLEVQAKP